MLQYSAFISSEIETIYWKDFHETQNGSQLPYTGQSRSAGYNDTPFDLVATSN